MPDIPLTYTAAFDNLFALVFTSIQNAVSNAIIAYTPIIKWQGKEDPSKPAIDKIWVRVSAKNVTEHQASLANSNGQKLFHTTGILYVELYCPRSDSDLSVGRALAQFIQQTFRTNSNSLWFTNQKVIELAPTNQSYPITVSINYEYDSLSS